MNHKLLKTYGLPAIVFLTGAAVLVVEVVAMRILSPYFGNTIFSVSSVLSTVLAALSLGYFFGGRLADRRPEMSLFYSMILLGGLGVFVIYLLKLFLLPVIGYKLPVTVGPLACSILLFFIPSVVLGVSSPFAVKLQALLTPERGMGRIAGEIFFWSTLGSITGSLLAGFVLVPLMGLDNILLTIGAFLTLMGLGLLVSVGGHKKKHFKLILSAVVLMGGLTGYAASLPPPRVVYMKDGVYERIAVTYNMQANPPSMFLLQDRTTSAIFYLDSDDLAAPHSLYYYAYKLFKPEIKEALVLGGGGYAVPKDLLRNTEANIDVAEIEPSLIDIAQEFFGLDEDARLTNILMDGRRFLHDTDKKYDLIFSDVYNTLFSVPTHFTTLEFFKLAHDRLSPDGVFVANLIGSLSSESPAFILSELKTFRSVFPNSYLFAVTSPTEEGPQNFMMVGCNCDKKLDLNAPAVLRAEDMVLRTLKDHLVSATDETLAPHLILTDDYAPVDRLMASTLAAIGKPVAQPKEIKKN